MVQQHADGDRGRGGEIVVGKLPRLEAPVDRIVELNLAGLHVLEDGERVDGFADRGGLKTRAWRHRPAWLRGAVAVGRDDRAVLDDRKARARHLVLCEQGGDGAGAQGAVSRRRGLDHRGRLRSGPGAGRSPPPRSLQAPPGDVVLPCRTFHLSQCGLPIGRTPDAGERLPPSARAKRSNLQTSQQ